MKLKIYTDWGSRWNPWNAWIWFYITDENWLEIEKRYKYLWIKTNNEAEYIRVYLALNRALELKAKEIKLFTDSKLVVSQLNWEWKVREERLKLIKKEIEDLIKNNFIKISFNWISREQNKEADKLSNLAMDLGS